MADPDEAAERDQPIAATAVPAGLDLEALLGHLEQTLLGGPRRYTRDQVRDATGTNADQQLLWRSLGFAGVGDDDVVFTDADITALEDVQFLSEHGFDDPQLRASMTRLLGQTFARMASWQGELLAEMIADGPELLASRVDLEAVVDELLPAIESLQNYVWRRQLMAYFTRLAARLVDTSTIADATSAVGFVDLAGFTSLTRRATEAELRHLLDVSEARATAIVGAHNGRIVKTIGDEVLFVADRPEAAALIALELVEAADADPALPAVRAGLAYGEVVNRLGDVYGSTVNLASRLTSIGRAATVLVDRPFADTLRGDVRFSLHAGRTESVRGFHRLQPWRLRRANDETRRR